MGGDREGRRQEKGVRSNWEEGGGRERKVEAEEGPGFPAWGKDDDFGETAKTGYAFSPFQSLPQASQAKAERYKAC